MSDFPKLIYRFNANLIKIQDLCGNSKGSRIAENFQTEIQYWKTYIS